VKSTRLKKGGTTIQKSEHFLVVGGGGAIFGENGT